MKLVTMLLSLSLCIHPQMLHAAPPEADRTGPVIPGYNLSPLFGGPEVDDGLTPSQRYHNDVMERKHGPAPTNTVNDPHAVVAVCLIIIGGIVVAVIIWGLWRMCKCLDKKINTPERTNDTESVMAHIGAPAPAPLPGLSFGTNDTLSIGRDLTQTTKAPDGTIYYYQVEYGIETKTNVLAPWDQTYTVTQWISCADPIHGSVPSYTRAALYKHGSLVKCAEFPITTNGVTQAGVNWGITPQDIGGDNAQVRGVMFDQ